MSDYVSSHAGADIDSAVSKIQAGAVAPQNYLYVSKNGNDSNNGAADRPFLTIQAAINAASSGTTIFIFPGTYAENLTLKAGVNLTASVKFGITITGNHVANFTGTVSITHVVLNSTTGVTLTFSGTGAQNLQFSKASIYSGSGDAIYYSNTNASSRISLEDGTCYVGTSGSTARCFYSESTAKGMVIANRFTFYIDNTANIALAINGAIGFTHTSDVVSGQIIVANSAYYVGQLVALTTSGGIPCLVTNSTGISLLFACVLTSTVTPISGAGVFMYSAVSYASTGVGAANTLNSGAGAQPMPLSSLKLEATTLKATAVDGLLEYDGTHLYFTIGTTRTAII